MTPTPPNHPGPPAKSSAFSRLLTAACWLYLGAIVGLCVLLRWSDQWWPATFLMFGPRIAFAAPLVLLLPAVLVARRPRLLLLLLLAGLLAVGPLAGGRVPWRALWSGSGEGMPLRVMTCNMHYSAMSSRPLDDLVRETGPDVIALQEWNGDNHSELLADGGWHTRRDGRMFLASRFPIRRADILGSRSVSSKGSVVRYELDTPAGVMTLFSLHLASPRQGIYEAIHEEKSRSGRIEANESIRRIQSEFIAGEARRTTGPVILVGDFNTPSESALFREVWHGFTNCFDVAGWGLGYTFHGGKTAVRIDHVLVGAGWRCRGCRVGPDLGSPHRPVLADLILTGDE